MNENSNKTIRTDSSQIKKTDKKKVVLSNTLELPRDTFVAKRPSKQHAFLEIIGDKEKVLRLGEDEVLIGRIPDCDLQLIVENVSRKHARLFYINEEYQIEDLNSTNGVYINGIKVEKCILRDQDILEIGGVKILFREGELR